MSAERVLPQRERYQTAPVQCFEPGCYAPADTPCIGPRRRPGHKEWHLDKIHASRARLAAMDPSAQAEEILRETVKLVAKVEKNPPKSRRARRYLAER